ncbi:hypothetical protein GCM10009123_17440 [Kangiella japonica]|uniref:CAAX prenyl protease 2/Lysostaphin resistance protein A-like domain-containing protein n=1 Tax=Kangiella japonica TaxID=647384 RepID=A0ABN0T2M5_9GAMM
MISKKQWVLSVLFLVLFVLLAGGAIGFVATTFVDDVTRLQNNLIFNQTLSISILFIAILLVYKIVLKTNLLLSIKSKKVYLLFIAGFVTCLLVNLYRDLLFDDGVANFQDIVIESIPLIAIVAVGVLCEELLFRKYLVDLGQGLGLKLWLSCLVSAVLFALIHAAALENSWFLIVSALVYSYFTYLFKSISFAVGAHLAFNILTMFTTPAGVESNLTTNYYSDVPSEWAFSSIMFDLNLLALVLIVLSIKGDLSKWHRQRIATQNI